MAILIIGAGIAGLTTALSLHQIGVEARVFESVQAIEPLGVGINTLPHAVRELTELGLAEKLAETAIPTAELAYYSRHGQLIWSEPRGLAAGYNWPQFSIHRGELQMILLAAARERLGADRIVTGHHLVGWEATNGGVRAFFIDRRSGVRIREETGELLIGADGIHSAVRSVLYPNEGPPQWDGSILWRGVTRGAPFLTGRSMIAAGTELQILVCYPISRAEPLINWIAALRKFRPDYQWRREDWNRLGDLGDFLPYFETWRFDWLDVPRLFRAAERCYEYPMVDRNPLERWTFGRVTLLGDAAHPMHPTGSNGASQAILDARVLAREIRAHGVTEAALHAYEAERRPPTAAVVLANRRGATSQVIRLVEERAPNGFSRIEDVLSAEELQEATASYKRIAGFDKDALNNRPPIVAI
jgi:2-polyprenyl-6-methoxyphenol hydroxylase-like FAD-dependent oxidoreductase